MSIGSRLASAALSTHEVETEAKPFLGSNTSCSDDLCCSYPTAIDLPGELFRDLIG